MKIHHVGYLVENIENSLLRFKSLGFVVQKITYDSIRDCNICFCENENYKIELVSPCSEKSVAYGLLKRYRNMPYHICYYSDDIKSDVMNYTNGGGYVQISSIDDAPAISEKAKVVFLMNEEIGMIELLEE